MRINPMLSTSRDIFLQARSEETNAEPTQQGVQTAKKLVAQYGSGRMVVVTGDIAVALKPQTFSEMETKFGKAKEIEKGVYVFSGEGSNLVANWYKTAVEDEGYGAADKNKDGVITNHESFQVKRIFDFDIHGNFFLDTPRKGEVPDNNDTYITLNDAIERDISSDTDKDGVISTAEIKDKEGKDIDADRKLYMSLRGQNPDGTPILLTREDLQQTLPGMDAIGTPKKKHALGDLKHRLQDIETRIEALRKQHVADDDPKLKDLSAVRQEILDQLKQSGARSIDVKA